MTRLLALHNSLARRLEGAAAWLEPSLARLVFAAVLLVYYWQSATTKLGEGFFSPSLGAYVQIFPRAMEAAGYDTTQLAAWQKLVVLAGTGAEFVLPAMLVLGLATRAAALGMIGFIALQTLTDLYGHGVIAVPETLGAWFDRVPDSAILDQRLLWLFPLVVLALRGGGPVSLDRLIRLR